MLTRKVDVFDLDNDEPFPRWEPICPKLPLQGTAHRQMLTAGSTKREHILITGVKHSASQLQSVFEC